jgi:DNA repair exonuclease SbcCD ATPase subunit
MGTTRKAGATLLVERLESADEIRQARLATLKEIERALDFEVYNKFKDDLDAKVITREQFDEFRNEGKMLYVAELKLRGADLNRIASQLESLNPQLETAIEKLSEEISALNNAVSILSAIGRVIDIIARIVGLA